MKLKQKNGVILLEYYIIKRLIIFGVYQRRREFIRGAEGGGRFLNSLYQSLHLAIVN